MSFAYIPLSLDIHTDTGLKFHSVLIFVYGDLLEPAAGQILVEFRQLCGLFINEILKLCDAFNLLIPGGGVDVGLCFLFSELEDLISDVIIILAFADFIQEFLLKLDQLLIDGLDFTSGTKADDISDVGL